jgi:hypothetical protein
MLPGNLPPHKTPFSLEMLAFSRQRPQEKANAFKG